jgi:hypothetical protein
MERHAQRAALIFGGKMILIWNFAEVDIYVAVKAWADGMASVDFCWVLWGDASISGS